MPTVDDLKTSKLLTKKDFPDPVLVTVKGYVQQDVSRECDPTEMKWCLTFHELEKPLAMNVTNGAILEAITGSANFDDWIDRKVILFNDKSVVFNGAVGGVRIKESDTAVAPPKHNADDPF